MENLKDLFPNLNLENIAPGEIFYWAIYVLVFLIFIIFTVIFFYHWRKYDWEDRLVRRNSRIYLFISALIFIVNFILIFILT